MRFQTTFEDCKWAFSGKFIAFLKELADLGQKYCYSLFSFFIFLQGRGQRRLQAVHIVDAVYLGGDFVADKPLMDRCDTLFYLKQVYNAEV